MAKHHYEQLLRKIAVNRFTQAAVAAFTNVKGAQTVRAVKRVGDYVFTGSLLAIIALFTLLEQNFLAVNTSGHRSFCSKSFRKFVRSRPHVTQ